ncbi:MAG: type II toxin-antitoxin system RelE/ParE family toxin [Planctomycetaceae bacterium]
MASIAFHPEAAAEFEEALCWYSERSERAAKGFDEAVSKALRKMEQAPERWPLIDRRHRLIILEKPFPYHVVYRVDDDVLTVIAVAHHRRRPRYWRGRR